MAHHQQASGPGGEHGLQRREPDEVQILRWLVQHQQVRGRAAVAETDEGRTHALARAERRQRTAGERERKTVDAQTCEIWSGDAASSCVAS